MYILNHKIARVALVFSVLFWGVGCSSDDDEVEKSDPITKLYYNTAHYYGKKELPDDATTLPFPFKVGDSFRFFVETPLDTVDIYEKNMRIEKIGCNPPFDEETKVVRIHEYKCTLRDAGKASMFILAWNRHERSEYINEITFDVRTYSSCYLIPTAPVFSIETGDIEMENKIRKELETTYFLSQWTRLDLEYTAAGEGHLSCIYMRQNTTVEGRFLEEEHDDSSGSLTFFLNNAAYSMTKKEIGSGSERYNLIQDLTSEFQAKYPTGDVKKVFATSNFAKIT